MKKPRELDELSAASESPSGQLSLYAPDTIPSVRSALLFEVKSWLGRALLSYPAPTINTGPQLLNLGCGHKCYPGFVNADFFIFRRREDIPRFWGLDLRYPLNCPDSYWDGVFTEHTCEHLHPVHVLALFRELLRSIKPGGYLRVVVPDLRKYVDYYEGRHSHGMFSRWKPRGNALRSISQNYLHLSLWDAEMLSDCLTRAGFCEVKQCEFMKGEDPRLLQDSPERAYESLYLEARKPVA